MRKAHFLVYQTGMFTRFALLGLALAVLVASFAQVSLRAAAAAEHVDAAVCQPATVMAATCRTPEPVVADHTRCAKHKVACGLDLSWGYAATARPAGEFVTGRSPVSRSRPPSAPAERILRPPIRVS